MKKNFYKQHTATSGLPDMVNQTGTLGNRAQKVSFYGPAAATSLLLQTTEQTPSRPY